MKTKKKYSLILSAILIILFVMYMTFSHKIFFKTQVQGFMINDFYPHDQNAFTQGLIYKDGFFYESTGLYGESDIRKVDPETGEVLKIGELSGHLFGEGLAIFEDKLYQLTWRSGVVLVYHIDTFELMETFSIPGEGWGLTSDGEHLIQSDGSDSLYFLNPADMKRVSELKVYDSKGPVNNINELEYIDGLVYANIWKEYRIAAIDPSSGKVNFWVDFTGIIDKHQYPEIDVMNGIAYDEESGRIFVTGKFWPYVYEVSIGEDN